MKKVKEWGTIIMVMMFAFSAASFATDKELDKNYVSANNGFGFKLLKDLKTTDENIMISPASISSALGALSGAGEKKEKDSILKAIGAKNLSISKFNESNRDLAVICKYPGDGITMNLANSLWLQDGLKPNTNYRNFLKNYYNANISNINFDDTGKAADIINQWCSDKTKGMITKALDSGDLENAYMVLSNALYFHGTWTDPFEERLTKKDMFFPYNKDPYQIAMMTKTEEQYYISTENFKAISIPYGENKDFAIDIIVPENEKGLNNCLDALVKSKKTVFETYKPQTGRVSLFLPRFQIEYKESIVDMLKKYGLNTKEYRKLLSNPRTNEISNIIHATKLKVNEKGTEAAAVTSVTMTTAVRDQITVRADKPFIFYIYDTKNKLIFFTGIVNSPETLK